MKALVVDGSEAERVALAGHLGKLGIESAMVATEGEAWTWLEEDEAPAVVLLAWNLPGSEGLALLRRLRADVRWARLPVVMVTAVDDLPGVEQALEAGASEYLMQPSDAQALLGKLLLIGVDPEARKAA